MKKLLSLILAVLILITSFGLTVFAEDVETENKTEIGSEITTDIEENNEAENNETEKEPADDIEQKPATYSDKVKKHANSGLDYIAEGLEFVVWSPALLLFGVIPGFGF